jgi:hypothetical protein
MHHTTTDDLVTFKAPGPLRPAGEPIPPRITIAPMVCLVDIHGGPVPDCERHTPTCPADLDDPAEWPESNDVDGWRWETGPDPADVEAAAAALEDLPFTDAPDADPMIHFPGIACLADRLALPPLSGGAPSEADAQWWAQQADAPARFVPSDADWSDYYAYRDRIDGRAAAARVANGYE